ncbi:MAG: hypothetical protein HYV06_02655 [Deltaproteobacteria bacterium]|nr:hypothetical protein [Deltaproteobacteria bacterium]
MKAVILSVALTALVALPCSAGSVKKAINERLLLIHAMPSPKGGEQEKAAQQSVYDGVVEHLTDKGYRVVDKASAEQCSLQIAATHDIDPLLNKAASFGLKFFAEYTIFFRTATITKDNDGGKGALVRVNAKVVDNTSSQVITSKAGDASSSGLTVDDAIDKAGRSAGKKLAATLVGVMEKLYLDSGSAGRIYTIVIESREPDADLPALLSRLELNTSVSVAKETESGGGKATFEVAYKGRRDQLDREILKAAGELGWRLQKVRAEGNRSTWIIK